MNIQASNLAVPEKRRPRNDAKARETRKLILDKTRKFLAHHGYGEFTIERLHRQCDLSQPTIYSHFTNKMDLYKESRRQLIHDLAEEFSVEIPLLMTPFDALHFAIRSLYDLHDDPRMAELRNSLTKDLADHPWIGQLFDQLIRSPALLSIEAYLLNRSRHRPMAPNAPRRVARQLWLSTEALAIAQHDGTRQPLTRHAIDEELELIANVYCSAVPSVREVASDALSPAR